MRLITGQTAIVGGYHGQLSLLVREQDTWQLRGEMASVSSPSYLLLDPELGHLWVINESQPSELLLYDARQWPLKLLASSATKGQGPCSLLLWQQRVYLCHYGSGGVERLVYDGLTIASERYWQAEGTGLCPQRQAQPHLHHLLPTPDGQLLAADLGSDRLWLLSPDLHCLASFQCPPGSGPRSLLWQGDRLWVSYELSDQLACWRWRDGALWSESCLSAHDQQLQVQQPNYPSMAIPMADQLWLANRGLNRLDLFAVQPFAWQQSLPLLGTFPRQFVHVVEQGELLIAQQLSHQVEIFTVASKNSYCLPVRSPTCVVLL